MSGSVYVWIREWVYVTVYVSPMAEIPNRIKIPSFLYYLLEEKEFHIFLEFALFYFDETRGTQMREKNGAGGGVEFSLHLLLGFHFYLKGRSL